MKISQFVLALAVVAGSERAFAQNPTPQTRSPQYYGYGGQAPAGSSQVITPCVPQNTACQPDKVGCTVTVCVCPCQNGSGPDLSKIPDIHQPKCDNPFVVIDENAPKTSTQTINISRNCYVPIQIKTQDSPTQVTPVDINVRWREVHFLCDANGQPLTPAQTSEVLRKLQTQLASAESPGTAVPASQPQVAAPMVNPMAAQPTPVAQPATAAQPTPAAASTPPKQWLWISNMNMYGYGYINEGGFAVVDEGSYRSTPPQTAAAPAGSLSGAASTTR